MNYKNFEVADFIKDEHFIRWTKSADEKSTLFWTNWMAQHPEKQATVEEAKAFILSMDFEQKRVPKDRIDTMLQHINTATTMDTPTTNRRWWMVAAAISMAILLGNFYFLKDTHLYYTTVFEETTRIDLPDGSTVTLNANSQLKAKEHWNENAIREVWLEGEALFEVNNSPTKGKQQFIVHAEKVDIQVMGTVFNVHNRDNTVSVVLTEGKVQVSTLPDNQEKNVTLDIAPGEMLRCLPNKQPQKTQVNTNVYTSWTNKEHVFDNTPLSHLVDILKNHYGLNVIVKNTALLDRSLTGKHPAGNYKELIKTISKVFQISIEQNESDEIIIHE